MKTNAAGRKIIVDFEGIHEESYPDPASLLARELAKLPKERNPNWMCLPGDPWTIGIGATGKEIGPGLRWSKDQVWKRFEQDLYKFERQVEGAVLVPMHENQFSALVSFTFNLGIGRLRGSTLLKQINQGDFLKAAEEFSRWVFAGGREMPGLRRRREAEQALFLTAVSSKKIA